MIYVVSTGFNPPTEKVCRESVRAQRGVVAKHRYINAALQTPPVTAPENFLEFVADLNAEDIVVSLDLDDWLATPDALLTVQRAHDAGAWVTYGSYITADGARGIAAPYETTNYRREPWRASHLKSYRAGLLHRIKREDLHFNGAWITRSWDLAMMLPCLEMAGTDRIKFIPDVLYIYNYASSFERNARIADLVFEKDCERHIRSMKPYDRLESL